MLLRLASIVFVSAGTPSPFSKAAPPFQKTEHPLRPTDFWGALKKTPLPTNRWFEDAILEQGDNNLHVYPYSVKFLPDRVPISLPSTSRVVDQHFIAAWFLAGLSVMADAPYTSHKVVSYDDIGSFTMQYTGSTGGTVTVPLVRGSPYITFLYDRLQPLVVTDWTNTIVSVNGKTTEGVVTGTRFELDLNINQTWIIYTSESVSFSWASTKFICTSTPKSLVVRVAVVDWSIPDMSVANAKLVLDKYAGAYATAASLDIDTSASNKAVVSIRWNTTAASDQLLIMALPHHCQLVANTSRAKRVPGLQFLTVVGRMCAIAGDVWQWTEVLDDLAWNAKRPIRQEYESAVRYAVKQESSRQMPRDVDPYTFGKAASGLARAVLVADQLNENEAAAQLRKEMADAFGGWLSGTNNDPLRYDSTWGGIVPQHGLQDIGADFGAGYYNDHHFHYGYFLYAAAVLAKGDSGFLGRARDAITSLARDIANPSKDDPYFPVFRHFDWYAGHSWAAGLFNFPDGRNQESTSEAINAWYGLSLWGLVTGDNNMRDIGRLLLASEVRGAQTYWQMGSDSSIYPKPFSNLVSVGMVWEDKIDGNTWFGGSPVFVFGIQMLPITPASELLIQPKWIKEAWPIIQSELGKGGYSAFWQSALLSAGAIIDQSAAWRNVLAITGDWLEPGTSNSSSLYFVATR